MGPKRKWSARPRTALRSASRVFAAKEIRFFADKPVKSVSCGFGHVLCLTCDGHVFAWGDNRNGQVGVDQNLGHTIALPREILHVFGARQVYAHHWSSFALTTSGRVFGWGNNKR